MAWTVFMPVWRSWPPRRRNASARWLGRCPSAPESQLAFVAMTARCYLFVPGDRPDMLAKAPARGADALIIDLEDAVAPSERAGAFAATRRWIGENRSTAPEIWVRIPGDEPAEECAAVAEAGLEGIVIPKARSPVEVEAVATALGATGQLPAVELIVLIETAQGLQHADEIAAVPGVTRLMSGEADMAAELGIAPREEAAWLPVRSRIVVASAAAGLAGPIAPVSPDFSDPVELEQQGRRLRRQGFRAGAAIHPTQVAPYMNAFAPDEAELTSARRIVELYDAALASGRGAVVDDAGRMVDEATAKAARRLLEEA